MKKLILCSLLLAAGFSQVNAQQVVLPKIADKITFSGLLQVRNDMSLTDSIDAQMKYSAMPIQSYFRIRRAEVRADAELGKHFTGVFRIQLPEFSSPTGKVLEYLYIEYKYKPCFKIRAGQFKTPFSAEELRGSEALYVEDRGTTNALFKTNNYLAFQTGVQLFGTVCDKMPVTYYAGIFNGNGRNQSFDDNQQKELMGRLEFQPHKIVKLGASYVMNGLDTTHTSTALEADIDIAPKLSDKLALVLNGEYMSGTNTTAFVKDLADTSVHNPAIGNYNMNGLQATALLKISLEKCGIKTLEIGGKYESTDPRDQKSDDAYSTITGNASLEFEKTYGAKLSFNVIQTNWEKEIAKSSSKNSLLLLTQLQFRF